MQHHDPELKRIAQERAAGLAMIGTILFFTVIGTGVGVFYEKPAIGAMAGAFVGVVIGFWLVPGLMRDLD